MQGHSIHYCGGGISDFERRYIPLSNYTHRGEKAINNVVICVKMTAGKDVMMIDWIASVQNSAQASKKKKKKN